MACHGIADSKKKPYSRARGCAVPEVRRLDAGICACDDGSACAAAGLPPYIAVLPASCSRAILHGEGPRESAGSRIAAVGGRCLRPASPAPTDPPGAAPIPACPGSATRGPGTSGGCSHRAAAAAPWLAEPQVPIALLPGIEARLTAPELPTGVRRRRAPLPPVAARTGSVPRGIATSSQALFSARGGLLKRRSIQDCPTIEGRGQSLRARAGRGQLGGSKMCRRMRISAATFIVARTRRCAERKLRLQASRVGSLLSLLGLTQRRLPQQTLPPEMLETQVGQCHLF